jgi:murein DD-endopeptidase MepM/ murein hydrolase activator NlpD
MKFSQAKEIWGKRILALLFLASFLANAGFSVVGSPNQQAISYIEPFLYPPYYGATSANYVMDHESPNNAVDPNDKTETNGEGYVVAYNGIKAVCPSKDISGCVATVNGKEIIADYDNHEGIDYGISFAPVLAAGDTRRVDYAGWYNPQNRGYDDGGFGLMVVLEHLNGYGTLYGHLSSIAIPYCSDFYYSIPSFRDCKGYLKDIKHGMVIGISGNTGHSDGQHLHFSVINFNSDYNENYHKYMDPYGWAPIENAERTVDPLTGYSPSNSLWVEEGGVARFPNVSLTNPARLTLPSGPSIPLPPEPDPNIQPIDDSDAVNFELNNTNCWTRFTDRGKAVNDSFYFADVTKNETCWAKWKLPTAQSAGLYDVYMHLAWTNDIKWAELTYYQVISGGTQVAEIIINGQHIVENVLSGSQNADPNVKSGWIYIGQYSFPQGGENYVKLSNRLFEYKESESNNVLADAVKFIPVNGALPPTPTPPPSSSTTKTIRVPISQGSDDAGTNPGGCGFSATDNEVYLGACFNGQNITSGFRFNNVQVPYKAKIEDAYINFTADGPYTVLVSVQIYGEASGNSTTFTATSQPASRITGNISAPWSITDTWNLGDTISTPNISFVLQQIIDRGDWSSGNSLSVIIKNSGSNNVRRVIAFERASSSYNLFPAELVITYSLNSVSTPTPTPVITSTPVPPTSTPTPTATVPTPQPTVCKVTCFWQTCTSASQPSSGKLAKLSWKIGQLDRIADQAILLYRVRDELLKTSSQGQQYIDLYYSHSAEIATIMNTHPELGEQGLDFIDLMAPNLQGLVDGTGDRVVITAEQVQQAEAFLDALIPYASPELQDTIAQERLRHPLSQLVGMTMEEAWVHLNGYQIEWLPPMSVSDPYSVQQGRTIPVEFFVTDFDGNFVVDQTLTLQVLDSNGNVVFGPIYVDNNPTSGITIQGNKYHYNMETKNLPVGSYTVQITYNSADGVQSVTKTITLTKKK